jgi:hypothetical protein
MKNEGLTLELPPNSLETIAKSAAALVDARPTYLSGPALCQRLGIPPRTLKTWRERGLPYRKLGHSTLMYSLPEVEAWIDGEGAL